LLNANLNTALIAPQLRGKVAYSFALRGQAPVDTVWGSELVQQFETFVNRHLTDSYTGEVDRIEAQEDGGFRLACRADSADDAEERMIHSRAVIVASGASPQRIFVPGEQDFWGTGVSFSAVSHASLFRERTTLVVGHGERAQVAALQLAVLAEHVYFIPTSALNPRELLTQQMEQHPAISILDGWELVRIEGAEYVNQAVISKDYEIRELPVEGVFIEMGLLPNKEFLRGVVEFTSETGHIPVNQRCETAVSGLFAAGDVTDVYAEQVPVAVGEGVKAAISAWKYLVTQAQTESGAVP
jgi:thioredoxin reductase